MTERTFQLCANASCPKGRGWHFAALNVLSATHSHVRSALQAEEAVLYSALAEQCGEAGAQLAQQARREHLDMGREVDSMLHTLLEEQHAWIAAAGTAETSDSAVVRDAAVRRQALLRRIEALKAAFIAHQTEEEASILPRIAAAVPGKGSTISRVCVLELWIGRCGSQMVRPELPALRAQHQLVASASANARQAGIPPFLFPLLCSVGAVQHGRVLLPG